MVHLESLRSSQEGDNLGLGEAEKFDWCQDIIEIKSNLSFRDDITIQFSSSNYVLQEFLIEKTVLK